MAIFNNYSVEEFQQKVKESYSYKELAFNLGYQGYSGDLSKKLQKYIQDLGIDVSHFSRGSLTKRTVENIFIENSTADQTTLRKWYLSGGYTPYECSICGLLPQWQDKPLSLVLDHINGNNKDDRLENLRWVCPNCNMQLPTTNKRKQQV